MLAAPVCGGNHGRTRGTSFFGLALRCFLHHVISIPEAQIGGVSAVDLCKLTDVFIFPGDSTSACFEV
jgi:hypothetical protein